MLSLVEDIETHCPRHLLHVLCRGKLSPRQGNARVRRQLSDKSTALKRHLTAYKSEVCSGII